jgi:hypothetical protein
MKRATVFLLALLVFAGCASGPGPRPPVVSRDAGKVDGNRSISTMSDSQWTVKQEPASPEEEQPSVDEEEERSNGGISRISGAPHVR